MPNERNVSASDYTGRHRRYWSYRNQDSSINVSTCCGQAAVYSAFRTRRGRTLPGGLTGLVRSHPPDNLFGMLGTSPGRVEDMTRALGLMVGKRGGFPERVRETGDRPVLVCLDVGKLTPSVWGLHWVAVFGLSSAGVHISNWRRDCVPREQFEEAWTAPLVYAVGMSQHYFRT